MRCAIRVAVALVAGRLPGHLNAQARVSELSQRANPFAQHNQGVEHRASVTYTARVEESREATGGYSVHLNLKYDVYCGPRCGYSLDHSRIVHFDARGTPMRIQGDQPPRLGV